jgi:predicted HD phosphohydrolase
MIIMGDDPSLPAMPKTPSLLDFFRLRFDQPDHLLQSARLAKLAGQPETTVLACLLHDIAVFGFIRGEHGYWGEQMVAPYVSEEVSWAIRAHQALRFFPDESVGYAYPQAYLDFFGQDYQPDEYIHREYREALNSPYYMTARAITIYDIYSFDPDVTVELAEFEDIVGRLFRQPEEGLGWDNTPASHLWRTILRPNKFL